MATLSTGATQLSQIERSRELAAALQQQASSIAPITHRNQGFAKLAQALLANQLNKSASKREKDQAKTQLDALTEALAPNIETQQLPDSGTVLEGGDFGPAVPAGIPGQREQVETQKTPEQMLQAIAQASPGVATQALTGVISSRLAGGEQEDLINVVNAEGQPVRTARKGEALQQGEFIGPAITPPTGGGGVREQKITDGMQQFDLSRADMVKLVDGHARVEADPFNGTLRFIDETAPFTGGTTAKEISILPNGVTGDDTSSAPTLWQIKDQATGPVNTMQAILSDPVSALGGGIDKASVQAVSLFKVENFNLVRALAVNPRFPVAEMKLIREEIDLKPAFFVGEEALAARMEIIDASLRTRMAAAEADTSDPNLPRSVRIAQGTNAVAIKNYLKRLGVPQKKDALPLPDFLPPESVIWWKELTPSEQKEFTGG